MNDGLILRALPPSWRDQSAANTTKRPVEKSALGTLMLNNCVGFQGSEALLVKSAQKPTRSQSLLPQNFPCRPFTDRG